MGTHKKRFVFLGSSGRIGQMLQAVWPDPQITGLHMTWQSRRPHSLAPDGLYWPAFSDPSELVQFTEQNSDLEGAFVFVGVTPSGAQASSQDMAGGNIDLVLQAVQAAAKAGLKRLIVASSSAVYGAGSGQAFRETDLKSPVNDYGRAKSDMEELATREASRLGLELCFLRIGNVVGADSLLGDFATRSEPMVLDIFPDGSGPRRSYIGPKDLAQVLVQLALHVAPLPHVLNVGANHPVAMDALLDAADLQWQARPVPDSPLQTIVLNCDALESLCDAGMISHDPAELIAQWRFAMGSSEDKQ